MCVYSHQLLYSLICNVEIIICLLRQKWYPCVKISSQCICLLILAPSLWFCSCCEISNRNAQRVRLLFYDLGELTLKFQIQLLFCKWCVPLGPRHNSCIPCCRYLIYVLLAIVKTTQKTTKQMEWNARDNRADAVLFWPLLWANM